MATKVAVPAAVIADAREALFGALGGVVEAIGGMLLLPERETHPEWFEDDRRQFERICRLLDLMGWDASLPARNVDIEDGDAEALCAALEDHLLVVEQLLREAETSAVLRDYCKSIEAMRTLLAALRDLTPGRSSGRPHVAPADDHSRELVALGCVIRDLREQQGMSKRDLARALRMRRRRLTAIEAGRRDVRYDVLLALARALDVEAHELLARVEAAATGGDD